MDISLISPHDLVQYLLIGGSWVLALAAAARPKIRTEDIVKKINNMQVKSSSLK